MSVQAYITLFESQGYIIRGRTPWSLSIAHSTLSHRGQFWFTTGTLMLNPKVGYRQRIYKHLGYQELQHKLEELAATETSQAPTQTSEAPNSTIYLKVLCPTLISIIVFIILKNSW